VLNFNDLVIGYSVSEKLANAVKIENRQERCVTLMLKSLIITVYLIFFQKFYSIYSSYLYNYC